MLSVLGVLDGEADVDVVGTGEERLFRGGGVPDLGFRCVHFSSCFPIKQYNVIMN